MDSHQIEPLWQWLSHVHAVLLFHSDAVCTNCCFVLPNCAAAVCAADLGSTLMGDWTPNH